MKLSEVPLAALVPDDGNSNRGTGRGRRAVKESLERFGAGRSVVVDADNRVIAGNKSLVAADELGMGNAIVVETTGDQLVVVKRTDLRLSERGGKARGLSISDNRSSELGLDWQWDRLAADLKACNLSDAFFTKAEFDAISSGAAAAGQALIDEARRQVFGGGIPEADGANDAPSGILEGVDPDDVPEDAPTRCNVGDLWALGDHRLLVGDCTDPANVARLFGDKRLRLVWTDPPYGVSYADKNAALNAQDNGNRIETPIDNDSMSPEATGALCRSALELACAHGISGAACYLACPPGTLLPHFIAAISAAGFPFRWQLVWVKNQFVLGRSDYHFRHENVLYGWKEGAHFFVDEHTHDSVFEVDKPRRSDLHPTTKPVALVSKMVKNSSRPGDIVYDPFTGSGTTLLSCVELGRAFRGCELDPKYADVILGRYENATGKEARLLP